MNVKIGTVILIVAATALLFGGGFALGLFAGHMPAANANTFGSWGYMGPGGMMGRGGYGYNMPRANAYGGGMGFSGAAAYTCPALSLSDDSLQSTAEQLGLSVEELEERLSTGEPLWSIAEEQGLSWSEGQDWMHEYMDERLDQAVQDGSLSKEQAEVMQERMDWMEENGTYGQAGCWNGPGGMRSWVR